MGLHTETLPIQHHLPLVFLRITMNGDKRDLIGIDILLAGLSFKGSVPSLGWVGGGKNNLSPAVEDDQGVAAHAPEDGKEDFVLGVGIRSEGVGDIAGKVAFDR